MAGYIFDARFIAKMIRDELKLPQADMPDTGGFAVTTVHWDEKPVLLVSWAHKGDNMRERPLSVPMRAIRDMLAAKGYKFQTKGNLFFILPECFLHLSDPEDL